MQRERPLKMVGGLVIRLTSTAVCCVNKNNSSQCPSYPYFFFFWRPGGRIEHLLQCETPPTAFLAGLGYVWGTFVLCHGSSLVPRLSCLRVG